jgi:hypothetical protein
MAAQRKAPLTDKGAIMRQSRITPAGMMVAVAFCAADCFLIRFWEFFAGGLLMSVALQAVLFRMRLTRGRPRRFWVGFEVTGLALLLIYLICHQVFLTQIIVPWTYRLSATIDGTMAHLPYGIFAFYRRYLFIDMRGGMSNFGIIAVQEVSFGVPMLMLALAAAMLAGRHVGSKFSNASHGT